MPIDPLADIRLKSRMVIEARYAINMKIVDKRGLALDTLKGKFKDRFPHMRIDNIGIHLVDEKNNPGQIVDFTIDRFRFQTDKEESAQNFLELGKNILSEIYFINPGWFTNFARVGVRLISVIEAKGCSRYEDSLNRVNAAFFGGRVPLTVNINDVAAVFIHEAGRIEVGPLKRGEAWVVNSFSDPEYDGPDFGFAFDVDSYATNVSCKNVDDLTRSFEAVLGLSLATEVELVTALSS